MLNVKVCKGTLALFGDAIDEIGEYYCQSEQFSIDNMGIQNRESRDGSSFHITILSPEDVEASGFHLKSEALDELVCNVNRMEVFNVGLGKVKTSTSPASEVWFALVFVEWAQALRSRLKLPNKHLHITLAFHHSDVHQVEKGINQLVQCADIYAYLSPLSKNLQEIVSNNHVEMNDCISSLVEYITHKWMEYCSNDKDLAIEHLKGLLNVFADNRIKIYSSTLLQTLFEQVSLFLFDLGYLVGLKYMISSAISTGSSLDLKSTLPKQLSKCKDTDKQIVLLRRIQDVLFEFPVVMSHSPIVLNIDKGTNVLDKINFPRNFTWVNYQDIHRKLAGSAYITKNEHFEAMSKVGIKNVISIHENSLPESLCSFAKSNFNIGCYHYFCIDRRPLELSVLEKVVKQIDSAHERGEGVLVHCQGGIGRTNMVIASYLMFKYISLSASSALEIIASQRKLILDQSQDARLKEWWIAIKNSLSENDKKSDSPFSDASMVTSSKRDKEPINYKFLQAVQFPPLIVMCGYVASGKSTLSKALQNAYPLHFARVNKDEMRGKGEFERALFDAFSRLKANPKGSTVIVDRCNLTPQARREILEQNGKGRAWCIFLDVALETCKARVQVRENHPTIPTGRFGLKILDSMSKQLIPPSLQEGFEKIIHITDEEEMMQLLTEEWRVSSTFIGIPTSTLSSSNEPKLAKFPRTPHICNLGAATRDDKLLSTEDLSALIDQRNKSNEEVLCYIEEKIDGANMGIFIDDQSNKIMVQNRSHFVSSSYHPQFAPLDKWIAKHSTDLWSVLEPGRHILYGEWVYATHSVFYNKLPDWFIAFDCYDKHTGAFLSRQELSKMLAPTDISTVPLIYEGAVQNVSHLKSFMEGVSAYSDSVTKEGIVLKVVNKSTQRMVPNGRAKLVRSDFIAGNERWNRTSKLQTNVLAHREFT